MEKFYKVNFKALLRKFTLAFRAQSEIDIFWKKGQKIAQSQKVPLSNMTASFNQSLEISCNMLFHSNTSTFASKVTKFQIILYTEKGNKKVGEVHFDVAPYLNQRNKASKLYDLPLEKCPDSNAKLAIELSAEIQSQISADTISNNSAQTVNIQTLVGTNLQSGSTIFSSSSISSISPKEPSPPPKKKEDSRIAEPKAMKEQPASGENEDGVDRIKQLEQENKRIRQQLKGKQKLMKENEEIKRKIKAEEYKAVEELREKIEGGRKEIEKLQAAIKRQVLLEKELKSIQDEIFKCKYQIMSAFNYANDVGGGKLLFEMQEACGLKQI